MVKTTRKLTRQLRDTWVYFDLSGRKICPNATSSDIYRGPKKVPFANSPILPLRIA
jgi:hypothetical protein